MKKDRTDKQSKGRNIVKLMWCAAGGFMLLIFLFFVLIYNGIIGYMPDVEELKNPADKFASVIYTADGEEMGRFFRNTGNRVYADYDEISEHVVNALIATEDSRFMDHSGIDFRALGRVGFKTFLMMDKSAGGGSTITQQLAKQLYSPREQRTSEPSIAETDRMDDCREARTILHQRGDHQNVSQSV